MKIIDLNLSNKMRYENNYIALGNFDGMHIAHIKIIRDLIKHSREAQANSSILLFREHTLKGLSKSNGRLLTSLDQKLSILEDIGLNQVFIIDFNLIKDLNPSAFLRELLVERLGVKGIFVGFDYHYGYKAQGNIQTLTNFTKAKGIFLSVEKEVKMNGLKISSSQIRDLVEVGDLSKAEEILGRGYWIKGKVVEGKKLGSKLGFPTANIELSFNYILPPQGVYVGQFKIGENIYYTATSIGFNKTFDEKKFNIEAHLLDFKDNIYGKDVDLRFIKKIRNMEKFKSIENLVFQVKSDILEVKKYRESMK